MRLIPVTLYGLFITSSTYCHELLFSFLTLQLILFQWIYNNFLSFQEASNKFLSHICLHFLYIWCHKCHWCWFTCCNDCQEKEDAMILPSLPIPILTQSFPFSLIACCKNQDQAAKCTCNTLTEPIDEECC